MMLIARNVAFYLVIGAVIAGLFSFDSDDFSYWFTVLLWPLVLILVVLLVISTVISGIVKMIKKGIHG